MPIVQNITRNCISCANCGIMNGFGGAGAFSDGKFNFTTEFGGWLHDYLQGKGNGAHEYADSINVSFGATTERYSTYSDKARELEKKALHNDLHLLMASVKHLGTENNLRILKSMYDYLVEKINIKCNTSVESISVNPDGTFNLQLSDGRQLTHPQVLPGRSGAMVASQAEKLGIKLINNQVDIGVRVELPAKVFEDITNV